jgi:hypothetical protein
MNKLGLAVAGVISLSMVALAAYAWTSLGDVTMSTGGWLALVGGGVAVAALGAALMGLVFYSNRNGFDEAAGGPARLNGRSPFPVPPSRETPNGHNPDKAG